MFGLRFGELLVIGVIALVFIGPKKLPGVARTLGKGMREFQNATRGLMDQTQEAMRTEDQDEYGDFTKEEVEAAMKKAAEEDPNTFEADVVASSKSSPEANKDENMSQKDDENKKNLS